NYLNKIKGLRGKTGQIAASFSFSASGNCRKRRIPLQHKHNQRYNTFENSMYLLTCILQDFRLPGIR
ncbi:hypothetical protein TNIN_385252, partial [Trichonephila inaurata madagascariensis]